MCRNFKTFILLLLSIYVASSHAQEGTNKQLPQMQFQGVYGSGHKDFNIYKFFDPLEDVLCYIMMPTLASKTDTPSGQVIYDSNTIGALSCFKIFAAPVKKVDTVSKKK